MYMHAFDFKTWFQTKVWRSLKETQNIEWNWDLEVVNLVVLYLSTNPKQPENIYLPMFYERNQIEDPAIMGESYKQLVIFLARTSFWFAKLFKTALLISVIFPSQF